MTSKATAAKDQDQGGPTPSREDIRLAYQIHTLAQMMYSQLAAANPWMQPFAPTQPLQPWANPVTPFHPGGPGPGMPRQQAPITPFPLAMEGNEPFTGHPMSMNPFHSGWAVMCSCPPYWR